MNRARLVRTFVDAARQRRRSKKAILPAFAGAAALAGLWLAQPSAAQQAPAPAAPPPATSPSPAPANPIDAQQLQLRGLEDSLKQSDEARQKLQTEIESIRTDRARLNAALIDTTAKVQSEEAAIADAEAKLDTSTGSEDALRRSLAARRDVIAEVLAALQRMGRRPPPAVLVTPQNMLEAVRASILLGAVVPELHSETEALASDLADLVNLRQSIATQRDELAKQVAALTAEQQRLSALVDARQEALGQAQQQLDAEAGHADDLARQASDLKDLIARMAASGAAADAARQADANRQAALETAPNPTSPGAASPFKDTGRLAPAISFADARGLLPLPVAGTLVKSFGAADGFGGNEKGISISTRPQAVVASPTDGWVAFSGPYRSYGQLLIINPGGGYYVVLAGMERINVTVGQFVLAGEPVASMGDGSARTAAAIAIGAAEPILYVEFRRDGAAIDPSPWWASSEMEKVRG